MTLLFATCEQQPELTADDQVLAAARGGKLLVFAPAAIGGLAEVRGFGPTDQEHEPAAVIDLEVVLSPAGPQARYQVGTTLRRLGVELPSISVSAREPDGAMLAVRAALGSLHDAG